MINHSSHFLLKVCVCVCVNIFYSVYAVLLGGGGVCD